MKEINTKVLILGAGWSGYLSADFLGPSVDKVILEKDSVYGGLSKTFCRKGMRFDVGGHRLCFKKKENISFLRSLIDKNDLLEINRVSKFFFKGKYFSYPLDIKSIMLLDKKSLWKIFLQMIAPKKNKKLRDNLENWLEFYYGKFLYEFFFKEYSEKVWGVPCSQISSHWAGIRIGRNSLSEMIKDVVFKKSDLKEKTDKFYYPRLGMGMLMDSLFRRNKNDVRFLSGIRIKKIKCVDKKLQSVVISEGGQDAEVKFEHLISTIPVTELFDLLTSNDKAVSAVQNKLKYRSLVTVSVVLEKDLLSGWHWCYFPEKEIIFSRIHEPKFWSRDMAEQGKTLVVAEIFCNYNDNVWNLEDADLADKVIEDMIKVNILGSKKNIIRYYVDRIKFAYSVHYVRDMENLKEMRGFLDSFENLVLTGRTGTHEYMDMEECIEDVRTKIDLLKK